MAQSVINLPSEIPAEALYGRGGNGGLTWKIVAGILGTIVLAVLFFLGSVVWTNTGRITNLENDVKYLHLQDIEIKARMDEYSRSLQEHRDRTEWQGGWIMPPKRKP